MTGWITLARERAEFLESQLDRLHHVLTVEDRRQLADALNRVETDHLAQNGNGRGTRPTSERLAEWWSGDQVTDTWSELHRIETELDRVEPDLDRVVEDAKGHVLRELTKADYVDLKARLDAAGINPVKQRTVALEAIVRSHLAAEAKHIGERQRQRGVVGISGGLLVLGLVTLVLQMFSSDSFLPVPDSGLAIWSWLFLGLVMFFGMVGGAVSALVSLYLPVKQFTDTVWFDPRPMLATAKLGLGLWTAVVGVLAVGSKILVGNYTSLAAALLLAFLFGYGQQALTGYLDRAVADLTK